MIIDLPGTTTSAINRRMVELRESGGAVALGRVLTLVVVTGDDDVEEAVEAANHASREHPCRVLVVAAGSKRGASRLDGQVRVGGDAGASEVIVLRLYGELAAHPDSVVVPLLLPDTPIVAWWPSDPPTDPSLDPVGAMAQRRITDSSGAKRPAAALERLAACHQEGDTDLAWTRITRWRTLLASALDQPPYEQVTRAVVTGASDSPSSDLLAAWLAWALKCPVQRRRTPAGGGMVGVRLERASGDVELVRPSGNVATLTQPGQPPRRVALARRATDDCLAEELRRLDPDDVLADVLATGLPLLKDGGRTTVKAATPDVARERPVRREVTAKTLARSSRPSAESAAEGRPSGGRTAREAAATKQATPKKATAKKASPKKAAARKRASS
ncbi:glucose-6-phosphate dehydrogenase assembly protein OpcA [Angustibacter speluncae]